MNKRCLTRRLAFIVLCTTVGAIAGCGGTGTLKGKVTFQGKPIVAGTVTVFASDGAVCLGEIQSDGSFEVTKIARGPAKVTVYSPDRTRLIGLERQALAERAGPEAKGKVDVAKEKVNGDGSRVNPPGWMKLPEKYADVATSDLTANVSGGTNTFDISLK